MRLARPFKITQIGPLGLFVPDVSQAVDFYVNRLGLQVTEQFQWQGLTCAYLRANTEHHVLALFPLALREQLGMSKETTLAFLALQVANYRQLQAARAYLRELGYRSVSWPLELIRGMDYVFDVVDPDGHVIRLYHAINQIGSSGQRQSHGAQGGPNDNWPTVLEDAGAAYLGTPFVGPLG